MICLLIRPVTIFMFYHKKDCFKRVRWKFSLVYKPSWQSSRWDVDHCHLFSDFLSLLINHQPLNYFFCPIFKSCGWITHQVLGFSFHSILSSSCASNCHPSFLSSLTVPICFRHSFPEFNLLAGWLFFELFYAINNRCCLYNRVLFLWKWRT